MSEAPAESTPARAPFIEWLKGVPNDFKLLAAAAAAVSGLLAPERLIPVPLSDFKWIPSLLVVLGLVLLWSWQQTVRRHRRALTVVTLVLFIVMIALNLRYVRAVDYQAPRDTVQFLIGERILDPALCGATPAVVIQQCGGDWEALQMAWGSSFVTVLVVYALSYVLFVLALLFSLGSVMLERSPARRRRVRAAPDA